MERLSQRSADWILVGTFFGVVTALAELAARLFAWAVLGRPIRYDLNPQSTWTVPFADLLLFGALGVIVALAATRWPGEKSERLWLIAFATTLVFTILLHFKAIHVLASALLSLGAGIQIGSFLDRRQTLLKRLAKASTLPLICIVLVTAFAFHAADGFAERRGLANLGPPKAGAPNVLVIVLDAVRAPDLSLYGYQRSTTPNLSSLGESSVVFERAIATAPWTLPSHGTMLTGRFPHELSADWEQPLDDRYPTLAEVLRDRGYDTGGFIANHYYGPRVFGLNRGFVHYEAHTTTLGQLLASSKLGNGLVRLFTVVTRSYYVPGKMDASDVNRRILAWLPRQPGSRPFFGFVNYFDAHAPYVAPAPYDRKFSGIEPPTRAIELGKSRTPAEARGLHDAYNGAISYVDAQLGILFDELKRRGLWSNTLVVVTADHGEEFGEHRWFGHANGLYFSALHVPLLISFPGRLSGGIRVAEPVTLRDLPATVVDLLGIRGEVNFPGRSLSVHWTPEPDSVRTPPSPLLSEVSRHENQPAWYAVSKGDMQSIIVGRHHYIRNGDGREELYDVVADPGEMADLAASENSRAVLEVARVSLKRASGNGSRSTAGDRRQ